MKNVLESLDGTAEVRLPTAVENRNCCPRFQAEPRTSHLSLCGSPKKRLYRFLGTSILLFTECVEGQRLTSSLTRKHGQETVLLPIPVSRVWRWTSDQKFDEVSICKMTAGKGHHQTTEVEKEDGKAAKPRTTSAKQFVHSPNQE